MASLSPQVNLIIDFPPKTSKSAVVCAQMNNQSPPLSLCACLLNMFIDIFRPREREDIIDQACQSGLFFFWWVGGGIGEKKGGCLQQFHLDWKAGFAWLHKAS